MPTPIDTARDFAAELTKLGVRAVIDPRKIVAPCLLIVPPEVAFDTGCGGTGTWTAYAIAAVGAGNSDAWIQLDNLVKSAVAVFPVERARPAQFTGDETSALPAYELTWTAPVEWAD